jgi:large subunit ribosomal protein L23
MSARDIIIRPIVTEKTNMLGAENKVTFEVSKSANKVSVAQAIKEIYDVKPLSVNIVNVRPKTKRLGRFIGKTAGLKKAIVKFKDGEMIDIFDVEG